MFTANATIESTAVSQLEMQRILYYWMYLIYDFENDLKVKQYGLFQKIAKQEREISYLGVEK